MNRELKVEAELFFKKYKKVKKEYLHFSRLREEKLGIVGYLSYAVLFLGVMLAVALKLNNINSLYLFAAIGVLVAASLGYIIFNQITIGIYEKKSKRKRDEAFSGLEKEFKALDAKYTYYSELKSLDYDEDRYKSLKEEEKQQKIIAEKEAKRLKKERPFSDKVCIYCRNGVCNFTGDESVFMFKCDYENCRWRQEKK